MMKETILSSISWIGVILCTLGYLLLSMKKISAKSKTFQLLNIFGGLFLMATAIDTRDLPNAASNLLWMAIGIYALGRQMRDRALRLKR